LLSATVPGKVIDYLHDARGRRVGRVVNGTLDKGWLYADALNPIAQYDSTGALEATFVYGTRGNVPDYIVQTDGDVYRIVADHLGSVRLVVDVVTGLVVHRMDYDAWGNVTYEAGDSSLHPFGFAGGIYDRGTGLVRFGARDYDSVTGRWTGKDPIRLEGGVNLLAYVLNNPINATDATGLDGWIDDLIDLYGKARAAKTTIVGHVVGLSGGGTGTWNPDANAWEYPGHGWIGKLTPAVTIGNVICYDASNPKETTRKHERAHTEQAEVLGDAYLPLHGAAQAASWAISKTIGNRGRHDAYHGYNPLEWGPSSNPPVPWSIEPPP
ncbi:MAG: RHS repeat-associated core domain-containing protein, partial [Myxococcales bacterium]|nr:RHS repeat-associated core domain-containing protein [Myxococcales bacterium]